MILWVNSHHFHSFQNFADFPQHHKEYFQEFVMQSVIALLRDI